VCLDCYKLEIRQTIRSVSAHQNGRPKPFFVVSSLYLPECSLSSPQIEEESPPEAGPEDDTHVGAVMSTSPIPISYAGSPLEQGNMPQCKIGTSPQIFSMSPEGWERIEEQEQGGEAGDQPEEVASRVSRGSAGTSVLREDYFAGLNPFRPEEREGDK
jgi:hypothetical protein